MSKYTCQLREVCESYLNREQFAEYRDLKNIVREASPIIFAPADQALTTGSLSGMYYGFWHFMFQRQLEGDLDMADRILLHFYTREICAESVGLWLTMLNKRVIMIAPKYQSWFNDFGTFYGFDFWKYKNSLFRDVNIMETNSDDYEGHGTERNDKRIDSEISDAVDDDRTVNGSDSRNRNYHKGYNDYPQSNLSGVNSYKSATEKGGNTESNTNTDIITHDESITGSGHKSDVGDYDLGYYYAKGGTRVTSGTKEPYDKLVERYKKATVNLSDKIIHEFDDLFLNIY